MRRVIHFFAKAAVALTYRFYPRTPTLFLHLRFIVTAGAVMGVIIIVMVFSQVDINEVYKLKNYRPPVPSKLLDRKGRLITTFFRDHRILVKQQQTPAHLIDAFVAIEDNHFFNHHGVDIQAIFRAFLINLQAGGVRQGGSTITQQLAKVILTSQRRTYIRKAKEAILALFIDGLYDKKTIMNMYFNQIYFGHGNYGIEAASRFYFKKTVSEITTGEAAILAALPSAPNRYSPVRNPRLSMNRMSQVLLKMIDMGFLSRKEASEEFSRTFEYYASLNVSPSTTAFGRRVDHAPYFSETVRKRIEDDFGRKQLYEGGLVIHSTLDLDHQKAAQEALWPALEKQTRLSSHFIFNRQGEISEAYAPVLDLIRLTFDLPRFQIEKTLAEYRIELAFHRNLADKVELLNLAMGGEQNFDNFLLDIRKENPYLNRYQSVQGAIVEIDQKTGEVTAMVGGAPFKPTNQLNRSYQIKRQPGSTFKAFLYAAAIEQKKITTATIFPDSPLIFLDEEGDSWMPQNYSGGYRGFITVREALRYSTNMVSIAVARQAGFSSLVPTMAAQLQVDESAIPHNLSVALGSYEVSPLQMARAFAVFPRGGQAIRSYIINRVEDPNGKLIKQYRPENVNGERVLSTGAATVMNSLLESVVNRGTGTAIRKYGYRSFAAGKTGTTNNYRDAWFAGYNKRYTTVVWIGYDRSTLSLGAGQSGGSIAAPVWAQYQLKTHRFVRDDEAYLVRGGVKEVTVCRETGKLPDENCTDTVKELFIPGTEPEKAGTSYIEIPENVIDTNEKDEPDIPREDFFADDDIF